MRSASVFTFILFLAIGLNTSAQNRQLQKTDSVLRIVKVHFRLKNADGIYGLAGANFKKALSQAAFRTISTQQLFPLGVIQSDSLISFENNNRATYKIKFETVTMQLLISLDVADKIELFQFQPYRDPNAKKPALAKSTNPLKSVTDKKVDSVARPYIQKANTVGLSIGILKDGKLSVYNYGETAKGNNQLPNASTLFEIGSITKTFTATLLAYYVNEGKISLNDPITKYLPDSVAANPQLQNITLTHLSNHTSGLPRLPGNYQDQKPFESLDPYKNYTRQLLFTYLKDCRLNTKPGEKYAYSNLAVGLLGAILERVSGKNFDQMVLDIICKPLQMKSTVQHLYPLISTRFTKVYNEFGDETLPWSFDILAPCSALRSSINDLALYTKANMTPGTDKLGKAFELTHAITFNGEPQIALGWHIIKVNGVNYYFHDGGTYGSSSFLAYNADKKLAVIILSNASESTNGLGVGLLKKLQ